MDMTSMICNRGARGGAKVDITKEIIDMWIRLCIQYFLEGGTGGVSKSETSIYYWISIRNG